MSIDDPRAIKFANEDVRPLCEKVRGLVAEINDVRTRWYGGLNTLVTNTPDTIEDGRAGEGVSVLTGADVNSVMGILFSMADATNAEIVAKPCVRSLKAS